MTGNENIGTSVHKAAIYDARTRAKYQKINVEREWIERIKKLCHFDNNTEAVRFAVTYTINRLNHERRGRRGPGEPPARLDA